MLWKLLYTLWCAISRNQTDIYLSEASDVYDLERRMRQIGNRRISLDFYR